MDIQVAVPVKSVILYILLPPFSAMAAVTAFTTWYTALGFLSLVGLFTVLVIRRYEKHQHLEYDDRFTSERMAEAFENYLREVKKRE